MEEFSLYIVLCLDNRDIDARFEVGIMVNMKIALFWEVMLYSCRILTHFR
jgi:hypothetical protein